MPGPTLLSGNNAQLLERSTPKSRPNHNSWKTLREFDGWGGPASILLAPRSSTGVAQPPSRLGRPGFAEVR